MGLCYVTPDCKKIMDEAVELVDKMFDAATIKSKSYKKITIYSDKGMSLGPNKSDGKDK